MHQFIHISGFGHKARPGEPRHATASGMLGEAVRRPGSTGHLSHPKSPNIEFGDTVGTLFERLAHVRNRARDSAGRRLRSDGTLIMIAVISYPTPRSQIGPNNGQNEYHRWKSAVIDWLKNRCGAGLAAVLEHEDESFLHLHAILFPEISPSGQLEWSRVHPGRAAKAMSALREETVATQDALYRRAMSDMQKDFHETVSIHFGHQHSGPKRERRERHHHLELRAAQLELAKLANANADLLERVGNIRREAALLGITLKSATDDPQFIAEPPPPTSADGLEPRTSSDFADLEHEVDDHALAREQHYERYADVSGVSTNETE